MRERCDALAASGQATRKPCVRNRREWTAIPPVPPTNERACRALDSLLAFSEEGVNSSTVPVEERMEGRHLVAPYGRTPR